jgi:outer membrane receptor protein involved in Fe transport
MNRVPKAGNIPLAPQHSNYIPQRQPLSVAAHLHGFFRLALLMVFFLLSLSAMAQKTVTGKVTDSNGEPLVGASVAVSGEKVYATTDAQGRYTISPVSDKAVLVFSYIGMATHKDAVGQRSVVNVRMMDNTNTISEVTVVSTGYQHISRERSSAAYGYVDSTAINRQMHTDLSSALEGKVAGLRTQINPNTGEQSVILRGVGTFSNDVGTSPLIVIDDMPTTMTLDDVNPYNVEGITKQRYIGLRPFVNAEVRFLRSFRYNLMYQYEWNQRKTEFYDAEDDYLMRTDYNFGIDTDGKAHIPSGGRYYSGVQNNSNYTFRNQLSFDRTFRGGHVVNALMGMEFRQNNRPRLTEQLMYGYNPVTLTSERMDWESLATTGWTSAVTDRNTTLSGLSTKQSIVRHRYASFYANAGYTYKYRYNITGSIRWDEADLFGLDTNDQHHPLWSVGAGWTLSSEKFMRRVAWVDFLKLRATYGINGNVDQTSTTYFVATYKTLSNPIRTTYLSYNDDDLPNPKLRWEKTATTNIGLDFRILNSRLSGNIEYYNRHASDLLVRRYMDATLGLTSHVVNNGEMRNRGVEVNLTGILFRNKDWDITASLTYAHNSNKMLKVDHSAADVAESFITSPTNYFMEGTSYNTLWAYRLNRVVNGYPVIMDAKGNELATFNSDGTLKDITTTLYGTDDLVNMGTLTPTYNGSLSLHAAWRGLEVNAFLVYSGGNKLRLPTADLATWDVETNDILNRWSESNADVPRLYVDMDNSLRSYASTFSAWWRYSDAQVRSADYVKLRSISVAYTLPDYWTRPLHLGATKLSFQVNNLLTWAKAGHHIDPETYGLNSGTRGIATPKTFAIGLSTSF